MSSHPSSSKFPIAYVEIRVFSHATEDLAKVEMAVRNTLPEPLALEAKFEKLNCVGHHGNPIVSVQARLSQKPAMLSVLQKLGLGLSSLDKDQLASEFHRHVEKHNLYLRLDKQSAFLGNIRFTSIDPIHFKIHFKNKVTDEIEQICRQAGLLP